MKRAKMTIVGAGNVGATTAHWAAAKELADLVLIDIPALKGVPMGKALDLSEAAPIEGFDVAISGSTAYEASADSDIVVITAGLARTPGMSRDDLLAKNTEIVKAVTEQVGKTSPNAILIVVSNPLDAMVYVAHKVSGFPSHRVLGMAGVLDTARYRSFIAAELGVSVEDIQALLMGGHGDDMVPLPRYTSVGGIPLPELLPPEKIDAIVKRTRNGGAEIVGLLEKGSAFYAPSAAVVQMAEAIIRDKKRVLPCAAYCDREYGVGGYFVGVPVKLGSRGVEQIIEVKLTAAERALFDSSVEHVRHLIKSIRI